MLHAPQLSAHESPAAEQPRDSQPAGIAESGLPVRRKKPGEDAAACLVESSRANPEVPTAPSHEAAADCYTEDHRLLTVREVADLLSVPVSWVYGRTRRRSAGRIPGIRLGKYWRFRREEVVQWIDRNRKN